MCTSSDPLPFLQLKLASLSSRQGGASASTAASIPRGCDMQHKHLLVSTIGVLAVAMGLAAYSKRTQAAREDDQRRTRSIGDSEDQQRPGAGRLQARVDADADKNAVTISGTVPTESLRMKAVDAAKTDARLVITDKIDVKPGVSTARTSTRTWRARRATRREVIRLHRRLLMTPGFTRRSAASCSAKRGSWRQPERGREEQCGHAAAVATKADRAKAEQIARPREA